MQNAVSRIFAAVLAAGTLAAAAPAAQAGILVGGSATQYIVNALNTLGVAHTDIGWGAMPATVKAGDTLILSYDGGAYGYVDYTGALNAGADIIVFGGSCDGDGFTGWLGRYINNDGPCANWHIGKGWTTLASNNATRFVPANYMHAADKMGYHMTHLKETARTVILGKNGEDKPIAAFRTYANGGSFHYMGLDLGMYGSTADTQAFTAPYLQGALLAARDGLVTPEPTPAPVPEPDSVALMGVALAGLYVVRRKRS